MAAIRPPATQSEEKQVPQAGGTPPPTTFVPDPSPTAWCVIQRIMAASLLVLSAPLLGALYLLVRATSPGPFLVRSRRVGYLGIPFQLYKIRTCRIGNPVDQQTAVGSALRKLKFDELPQLWNVVRGDMQFVGPRPLPPEVADELAATYPAFERRYSVAPGLGTVGQVSTAYDESDPHAKPNWRVWIQADRHYMDHRSVSYDLVVLVMQGLYVARKCVQTTVGMLVGLRPKVLREGTEQPVGHHVIDWANGSTSEVIAHHSHWMWRVTQRVGAGALLIGLAPLFAAMYIAVKATSRGPFLFKQKRRGLGGVPFTALKVRTMQMGSEAKTALGVQNSDPTITRFGGIFRTFKLDELPQLWNVLCGDMEFAGPRPIPMALEEKLEKHIPGFSVRQLVKPGLTNLAQISVMDNELSDRLIRDWTLRSEAERHYVEHNSVTYDLVLIFMTVAFILRKVLWRGGPDARNAQTFVPNSQVLGVPISNLDYEGVIGNIARWLLEPEPHRYICVSPVHSIVEARLHKEHRRNLAGAHIVTADGMPVVWAQRLLGNDYASRVYGPTLMLKTLENAAMEGWKIAFYGGHPDRLELMQEKLHERIPGLEVVFSESPPFRELSEEEDQDVVDRINAAAPDIIWVGLGCPKQERWMAEHHQRVRGVLVGVGAAFDFHAGIVPQAPAALQRFGLEWAYRLFCEPRRLFRRYATTNPIFVGLFGWQLVKQILFRRGYQSSPLPNEHK